MAARLFTILTERLPEPAGFVELLPEELAPAILEIIRELGDKDASQASPEWFTSETGRIYGKEHAEAINRAFIEGWGYLQREGLVERRPDTNLFRITRKGEGIKGPGDWRRYESSKALSRPVLHQKLEPHVWPPFARGEYGPAVFQAFLAVEVAVRTAGGFKATDVGVELMTKAFKPGGPLVADDIPEPEQKGMHLLFMGAFALYRNSTGHRYVQFADPAEAAEVILLANHLMRVVERIAASKNLPFRT